MLQGRTIIVTGAARGLGRTMVLALAGEGANIAALDLPSSAAQMAELMTLATTAGCATHIHPVEADITNPTEVTRALERITARCGTVFGLVNNAGRGPQENGPMQLGARKRFYELEVDLWRGIIDSNLNGAFIMARAVAPGMVAAGTGRIVNVVTSFHTMQAPGFSPYGPSKAALEAATVIWAKDLAGTGVTVNALLPGGAANTRMIPEREFPDRATLVKPEVMRAPILWLMSDQAGVVTGQRFIGQNWNATLPASEAARIAGASAGFGSEPVRSVPGLR
jgi:NAD(P)-dependent dehydrogenase (short-subunit alcohol dehydrogenase family)